VSEKELDPTPARIARARRENGAPRSAELVAAAAFGAASLCACASIAPIGDAAQRAIALAAGNSPARGALCAIVALALLPAAAGALAAVAAGLAQGASIGAAALSPRVARLDPAEGLRRMFSRETPAHAMRALLAFGVASAAIAPAIGAAIAGAARASQVGAIALAAWSGTSRTLAVACAVGALFAAAEYRLVRGAWLRKLRMSFDDLRREIKEQEGDPHVRSRRASRHRDLSRGSVTAVRDAAFVVVNPSHIAIALSYRPPEIPVPSVLVRAADEAALRVRALARQWAVPVVESPQLAQALYAQTRVGAVIPIEHYVAVAAIVVALGRTGALP
jgi:flagellar biosynthetic protein FlhB